MDTPNTPNTAPSNAPPPPLKVPPLNSSEEFLSPASRHQHPPTTTTHTHSHTHTPPLSHTATPTHPTPTPLSHTPSPHPTPPLTQVGRVVQQRQQHPRHVRVLHGRHTQPRDEVGDGGDERRVQAAEGPCALAGALADGGPHLDSTHREQQQQQQPGGRGRVRVRRAAGGEQQSPCGRCLRWSGTQCGTRGLGLRRLKLLALSRTPLAPGARPCLPLTRISAPRPDCPAPAAVLC